MTRLAELAKIGVEQIRLGMERPDQDWLPTLMYLDREGKCNVLGIALGDGKPGTVTPEDITRTQEFVGFRLEAQGATEAVFVCTVVMRQPDEQTSEGVMVVTVTRDSTEIEIAGIVRCPDLRDKRPVLGAWTHIASDLNVPPNPIIDAMRSAI